MLKKLFFFFFIKPFSFLPALCMMYLIFTFSSQSGDVSSQLSYKVTREVLVIGSQILDKDIAEGEIDSYIERYHGPVRKLAHMTEYFCLAVCIAFPLYVYGLRGFPLLLFAGMICAGFACTDEYHQSMVAGRGPSARDVLIDSIGAFFGIIAVRMVCFTALLGSRPKKRKKRRRRYT